MKTPQEEAEQLAEKVAEVYHTSPRRTVVGCVESVIPLAELIAVARAADRYVHHGVAEDFLVLEECVESLRETGKVEGI